MNLRETMIETRGTLYNLGWLIKHDATSPKHLKLRLKAYGWMIKKDFEDDPRTFILQAGTIIGFGAGYVILKALGIDLPMDGL